MRIHDKHGQASVRLDKGETNRIYEAAYLLRRAGKHLEHDGLLELAAEIILAAEELAPEWVPNPETGVLEAAPKEARLPENGSQPPAEAEKPAPEKRASRTRRS